MKNIPLLSILTMLLFVFSVFSEENNPCLHDWGDVQYECTTSLTWENGNSLPCSAVTDFSHLENAAKSRASKSGTCKRYKLCRKCGERDNLSDKEFGSKSASCTHEIRDDEDATPSAFYAGSYHFTVTASCHTERSCSGWISVEGHSKQLSTSKTDRRIFECYMTGKPPHTLRSGYVSLQNVNIPLGTSLRFGMDWSNPDDNNLTDGKEYFKKAICTKCSVKWTFKTDPMQQPGPFAHAVKHPAPTGGGSYLSNAPSHSFLFDQVGSDFKVTFLKECEDSKVNVYGWAPADIPLFPCKDGEFEYTVKATGVQSLNYAPVDKKVYYKEVGKNSPKEKTLYVLSEITAEAAKNGGNKARQATTITFTATATGNSWPSVDPVLGGFSDSELSESDKAAKADYKYPTWNKSHPHCNNTSCIPDHFEFTGAPGSATATFKGKAVGSYTVDVHCGTENNPADSNDNLGVRRRVIKVCNPLAIANFAVSPNAEKQKVIDDLTPCDAQPIPITFGGDMNGIPEGETAYLKIEADRKTYELYKDPAGEIEASAADLALEVGEKTRKTVYLLPIQKDSNTLVSTYKAVTKYGIANTLVKSDDVEDILTINWRAGGCSGGVCAAPWVSAQNSSVKVQGSFGQGAWGKSGGAFQIYADKLNYRLLDNKAVQIGKNEDGEPIMSDPGIRFVYGNSSSVKIATAEDAANNSNHAEGYPIRVKTGRYCSEFSYRTATVGTFTFVDKMTITQYLSSDTDASAAMTGASPIAVTTLEMLYNSTIPADTAGPEVTALNVTNTQYSGATSTTQTWGFTAPETSCPDLTGNYTISQLNQNGVNNILAKQEYTENGLKLRREIRYIGSMSNPVAKEDYTYCEYPWGEETVSETVKGATTTYEFYTDPAANGYSKQKKVTYPQGNYILYEYNAEHEVIKQTELRGSLTYVTTFEYEYDGTAKKRTTTTIQKVGDIVISRNKSVTYEDRLGNNPDESIRFDENGNQYVTKTWYTQGPNGTYDIRPKRQENPDGTATRYTYVRSGNSETSTTETGVFNGDTLILGTRQVSISNENGVNVSSESWFIDSANSVNVKTASTVNSNFDEFGRSRTTTYLDGSTVTRTYGCCGVSEETDRDGVTTTYAYDEFKRVSHTVRDGITTLYSYDALGNQTSVTVKGRNDAEITTSSTYSDGELANATDALGNVTAYTRTYAADGDNTTYTETVTKPDGSTQISVSVNGQQVSTSGTAVHGQTFEYGPNWQKVMPQNQIVYTDLLGRNFKTEYADGTYAMNYYNSKNQLVKSVTPGGVVTLYSYDNLGRQISQAIDMNRNGEIDAADLVTSTAYSYGTQNGKTVSITTQTRSQGANSAVISVKKQSVDGLESWQTNLNGLTTHTKLERLGGGNTRQTVTNPDGTKVVTNSNNGRVITVQNINSDNTNGNLITYTYDEFDRQAGTVETFGTVAVNTSTATYDSNDNILTQTVNGQTTGFEYDVMGRRTKVTAPGGVVTNTVYYPTGEVRRVDGATYPVEYTYNALGKQATMKTFKDADTPQVTSWTYNARGEMVQKTYADGNSVNYTYNADGQLLTRTWARGIVTTYTYDNAGRATGYNYSDGVTPAVVITLDFLDRPSSVADAAGTRNLTYSSDHLQTGETIPGIMDNMGNSCSYDAHGRRISHQLNTNGVAQAVSGISYDVKGRVADVGNGTDTLYYAYRPGLSLLDTATWRNSQSTVLNTRTYAYDTYHRLTGINLNNVSEVAYTLNDKDQRTAASYAVGGAWSYSYDNKNQVTGATGGNTTFSYVYDGIGNRLTAAEGSNTWSYTSNLLNQYTAINNNQPTYDVDGNMLTTGDGWLYTWNGENRLIRAESRDTLVEMAYDYLGRRIEKKVSIKGQLSSDSWNVSKHYKFVYNERKLTAVYDAANNNALLMTFTWQPEAVGLDVPVCMIYGGNIYYYITDGNKNVTGLLDQAGNRVAEYAYGPFGQPLSAEGELAEVNPFRFSSEYADDETGLIYYNYRYYNAKLGRWINRDPVQESGGKNLYILCNNNACNRYDNYGLSAAEERQCKCYYRMLVSEFYRIARRSPKLFKQLTGNDCYEGSVNFVHYIEKNFPEILKGYTFSTDRRGRFYGQARRLERTVGMTVDVSQTSPVLVPTVEKQEIWYRYVILHSIAKVIPGPNCSAYMHGIKAFDHLEASIYEYEKFKKEYPLDINATNRGFFEVYPPPRTDILKPNQSDSIGFVGKTPVGMFL